MTERSLINIAMSINSAYAPHAAVMMSSLLDHTEHPVAFYIFSTGLADSVKNKLGKRLSQKDQIHFVEFSPEELPENSRIYETLYRFLIPKYLKSLDRVLYLDVDVIIQKDIADVYFTSFEGNILAAVPECSPVFTSELISKLKEGKKNYFNAGILLMNLSKLTEKDSEKWIDTFSSNPSKFAYRDQCVLNWYYEDYKHWPLIYNVVSRYYVSNDDFKRLARKKGVSIEGIEDPYIIHYTMPECKPWHIRCIHPKRSLYLHYLLKTPWWSRIFRISIGRFVLRSINLIKMGKFKIA